MKLVRQGYRILLLLILFSGMMSAQDIDPAFAKFEVDSLLSQMKEDGKPWLSFFDGENLFTGVYVLEKGAVDRQQPHKTDEVYYVLSGESKMEVNGEVSSVQKGDVLFVKAGAKHRFFDIVEDLQLLVFFEK